MRQHQRAAMAILVGSLSLAGALVAPQLLGAADLPQSSQSRQQDQEQSPAQPVPQSEQLSNSDVKSNPAEIPAAGQPEPGPAAAPKPVVLERSQAQGILGKEVRSAADENMGRIVDVIVDRGGNTRAAVIDFGGFLGVGSRKIAVDWSALNFVGPDGKDRITIDFTRDQVKAAPEYQDGKPIVVLSTRGNFERSYASTSANGER